MLEWCTYQVGTGNASGLKCQSDSRVTGHPKSTTINVSRNLQCLVGVIEQRRISLSYGPHLLGTIEAHSNQERVYGVRGTFLWATTELYNAAQVNAHGRLGCLVATCDLTTRMCRNWKRSNKMMNIQISIFLSDVFHLNWLSSCLDPYQSDWMILEAGLTHIHHDHEFYTRQPAKNTARILLPVYSRSRVWICQYIHSPITR